MYKSPIKTVSVKTLIRSTLTGLVATMLALTATAASANDKTVPPTTIYFNAHIFTAEYATPYAEAIAIRADRILAVGAQRDVEKIAGKAARKIDLHGKFLMPGMIDAHAHPMWGGMTLVMANYPDTNDSIPDLINFINQQIDNHKSFIGDTLVVYDIDLGYWAHAAELDAILSQGRYATLPIVLNGSDFHTSWANQAARQRAGITADYLRTLPKEKQKFFGFDAAYVPNGFVVDFGKNRLDHSLPAASAETVFAAGTAGVQYMNSLGITGWLDAAATGDASGTPLSSTDTGVLPTYGELARRGMLSAHVAAYPVVSPDAGTEQIASIRQLQKTFRDVPNLTIPGLKIFADGVVEFPSQTAAMTGPYVNSGRTVAPLFKQSAMNALVLEADRQGLQVHVHAIGNGAVKATLDAFEAARKANPNGKLKHAITHAQFVDEEDQQRFAQYNVIAALQLLWALADPSTIDIIQPYIDPTVYKTMYPSRSLLEKGTEIAGASDWPISSAAPFEAISQSETRLGSAGVLFPEQRMPRMAMLYAYTRNAADALNQLQTIGTLAPGKRADLVLVDRDVLTVNTEELKESKILATMFGGKQVYGEGL